MNRDRLRHGEKSDKAGDRFGAGVQPEEFLMERPDRAALDKNSKTAVDLPGQPGETEDTQTRRDKSKVGTVKMEKIYKPKRTQTFI